VERPDSTLELTVTPRKVDILSQVSVKQIPVEDNSPSLPEMLKASPLRRKKKKKEAAYMPLYSPIMRIDLLPR
jgi:hypothetical protein